MNPTPTDAEAALPEKVTVRYTASTITDPELEKLYAQCDLLLLILAAARIPGLRSEDRCAFVTVRSCRCGSLAIFRRGACRGLHTVHDMTVRSAGSACHTHKVPAGRLDRRRGWVKARGLIPIAVPRQEGGRRA